MIVRRTLRSILRDTKIGAKINIVLAIVFLLGIILSGNVISKMLEKGAEHEVSAQAYLVTEMTNSVREYSQKRIHPLIANEIQKEDSFIPESIPSFSAREVADNLRKQPGYENFIYKEAMVNPTNLRDLADRFERSLITRFQLEPELNELSGFWKSEGRDYFYLARPVIIRERSCLKCHSSPERAPKSLLDTYGKENGFNWKLNEVLGSQVVFVPAEAVLALSRRSLFLCLGLLVSVFVVLILVVSILLRKLVVKPIEAISREMETVSMSAVSTEGDIYNLNVNFSSRSDEIGCLMNAFNRMKQSLIVSISLLNKRTKSNIENQTMKNMK